MMQLLELQSGDIIDLDKVSAMYTITRHITITEVTNVTGFYLWPSIERTEVPVHYYHVVVDGVVLSIDEESDYERIREVWIKK